MIRARSSWFLGLALTLVVLRASAAIYDRDDRQELFEIADPTIHTLADSTLAIFSKSDLRIQNDSYILNVKPATVAVDLCPDERFANQPGNADCSATLIAKDLVLTAGHCMTKRDCKSSLFAFGYSYSNPDFYSKGLFPKEEVYSCREILSRRNDGNIDFAVLRLDREVRNHRPLPLKRSRINKGDEIFMIGHPSGLPLKYSGKSVVTRVWPKSFVSRIDAIEGNSGSGVIESRSLGITGILVNGGEDYYRDSARNCMRITQCGPGQCPEGEISAQIQAVTEALVAAGFDLGRLGITFVE